MGQRLGTLAALPEDPGLILSTQWQLTLDPGDPMASVGHICVDTQDIHLGVTPIHTK